MIDHVRSEDFDRRHVGRFVHRTNLRLFQMLAAVKQRQANECTYEVRRVA